MLLRKIKINSNIDCIFFVVVCWVLLCFALTRCGVSISFVQVVSKRPVWWDELQRKESKIPSFVANVSLYIDGGEYRKRFCSGNIIVKKNEQRLEFVLFDSLNSWSMKGQVFKKRATIIEDDKPAVQFSLHSARMSSDSLVRFVFVLHGILMHGFSFFFRSVKAVQQDLAGNYFGTAWDDISIGFICEGQRIKQVVWDFESSFEKAMNILNFQKFLILDGFLLPRRLEWIGMEKDSFLRVQIYFFDVAFF